MYTVTYNCQSMKQFSWVIYLLQNCRLTYYDKTISHFNLWQNCSLTDEKTIFQFYLRQDCSLTYDKTIFQLNLYYDKNAVWPMINLQMDLWQKYSLTYDKNTV